MLMVFRRVKVCNLDFCAFSIGHDKVTELLLSRGATVDLTYFHATPLHIAAVYGKASVMKILLEHHADVISKLHSS